MVAVAIALGLGMLALASVGRGASDGEEVVRFAPKTAVMAALEELARNHPELPRWWIYAMAQKESGFRPRAYHGGREDSLGIFQVNWRAHAERLTRLGIPREALYDPRVNAWFWGILAEELRQAAIARGYRPPGLWYVLRLRLKGIRWADFRGELARQTVLAFRPIAERWQRRMA